MRSMLRACATGGGAQLALENADLRFNLASLEVKDAAVAVFADEQGSPVGPNFVAVDDFRCCQVVRGALLIVRCHFLTPCFEAAGAPLSFALLSGAGAPSQRLSSGAADD